MIGTRNRLWDDRIKYNKFIFEKIRKEFGLPLHSCDKCRYRTYYDINSLGNHCCDMILKVDECYLKIEFGFEIYKDKITFLSARKTYIMENCSTNSHRVFCKDYNERFDWNYYEHDITKLSAQIQNIIIKKPKILKYLSNLVYEFYYTDTYILLLKKYFTFLLVCRFHKPYSLPYDVAKIIAKKILF